MWERGMRLDWRYWGLGITACVNLAAYSGISIQLGPVGFYLGKWNEVL